MPEKIFLWTAPRCVSTAFERSIMEIKGSKIFHEPYSKCYYFGPERQSRRYLQDEVDQNSSYKDIQEILTNDYDSIDLIFSKDMAYAIENHYENLLEKDLSCFQHTFLIRSPVKAITSLYKASTNKQLTGWDYFDPVEAGFKQLYDLYTFVEKHFDVKPVVVDADDLLENPEGIMAAYCKATHLDFNTDMLTWVPGPISDWDVWNGWHDSALKSSGFRKHKSKTPKEQETLQTIPEEVKNCIEESLPYYIYLFKHKISPLP